MKILLLIGCVVAGLIAALFWPTNDDILTIIVGGSNTTVTGIPTKSSIVCELRNRRCFLDALQFNYNHYLVVYSDQHVQYHKERAGGALDPNTIYYIWTHRGDAWAYKTPALLPRIGLEICRLEGATGIWCPPDTNIPKEVSFRYSLLESVATQWPDQGFLINATKKYRTPEIHMGKMYEELNKTSEALKWYKKVPKDFYAVYRKAVLTMTDSSKEEFQKAYQMNPLRREPLYYLARLEREKEYYVNCMLFCQAALSIDYMHLPLNEPYIEYHLYAYGVEEQYAECLYHAGHKSTAKLVWKRMVNNPEIPINIRNRIAHNLQVQ